MIKPLHPRNLHHGRYDFPQLIQTNPGLEKFVFENQYGDTSIDFAEPKAVLELNRSLLKSFYQIEYWDIPQGYLCPPIPGRADYIHYIADLLAKKNSGEIPQGKEITGLDIGTGANCIYPIIGNASYQWSFVTSDIDKTSLNNVQQIINKNVSLKNSVDCRYQEKKESIFTGIIKSDEYFDFTMCNPPFHSSAADAASAANKKQKNLKTKAVSNFGGTKNELWCAGGEVAFIKQMISESKDFSNQCGLFTTLVSKKENLHEIHKQLKRLEDCIFHTIEMKQGQKISRFVAWSFR